MTQGNGQLWKGHCGLRSWLIIRFFWYCFLVLVSAVIGVGGCLQKKKEALEMLMGDASQNKNLVGTLVCNVLV